MAVIPSVCVKMVNDSLTAKGFEESPDRNEFVQSIVESILEYLITPNVITVNTVVTVTTPAGPGTGTGIGTIS